VVQFAILAYFTGLTKRSASNNSPNALVGHFAAALSATPHALPPSLERMGRPTGVRLFIDFLAERLERVV